MSDKVIITYKKLGQTPLEQLDELKVNSPELANSPLTYAGRLDPMAEGLMIVLAGEECKNKDQYLGLDKTYEFEILVGFSTDTYDLLGVVTSEYTDSSHLPPTEAVHLLDIRDISKGLAEASLPHPLSGSSDADSESVYSEVIKSTLPKFQGTFMQKYPSFSSKTVDGKQLFQLALDDELPSSLPEHEVTIHKLQCTSTVLHTKENLEKEIIRRIGLVHGDFRQEEIIKKWHEVFQGSDQKEFMVVSCVMDCSSGTYVRQLVSDIGEKIGIPLVTYSIKRTRVGEYKNPVH